MRRRGAPFSRHGIGVKTSTEKADTASVIDPAYVTMQRGLSDGMNHIAQSIMNSGGRGGILSVGGSGVPANGAYVGGLGLMDGDLVSNSTGELETPRRENIPLRPLMLNGSSGGGVRTPAFTE